MWIFRAPFELLPPPCNTLPPTHFRSLPHHHQIRVHHAWENASVGYLTHFFPSFISLCNVSKSRQTHWIFSSCHHLLQLWKESPFKNISLALQFCWHSLVSHFHKFTLWRLPRDNFYLVSRLLNWESFLLLLLLGLSICNSKWVLQSNSNHSGKWGWFSAPLLFHGKWVWKQNGGTIRTH